jgi:MFS family permease
MPLVFSVKQTAVPAGLLLSGLLGPAITHWVSWRAALDVSALACLVFALMLQPLAREFDSDRDPSRSFHFSDFATTLTAVLSAPELRRLSMACFAFNGLQTVFTSYFIILLTEAGYGLSLAGLVFSIAMMVAVPGRILWGWMGSSFVAPRAMMGALALGMAVSSFALAFFGAGWPVVVVGLVASALSATAMSWHGVLLAEAARLAPHMRGAATGGVLSFGQVGALLLPLVFAGILWASGSYGLGFAVCGLPALVVGIVLLRPANAQTGGDGG